MKLVSWNVNGIRAAIKKEFFDSLEKMNPDVICLQETKAQDDQVIEALKDLADYRLYCNSAIKKGYSGTAILTKTTPITVKMDIGIDHHDQEGRVIAAEFEQFILITVYTPNSGSSLKRLDYRQTWDQAFLNYIKQLERHKPVVICGDLNVANTDLDLARPKPNYNKTAGYMQQEIDGIENLKSSGLIDSFRHIKPNDVKYSWWSYRAGAREKNVGWRIDYFLLSESLSDKIEDVDIYNDITGSDHCPVMLTLGS